MGDSAQAGEPGALEAGPREEEGAVAEAAEGREDVGVDAEKPEEVRAEAVPVTTEPSSQASGQKDVEEEEEDAGPVLPPPPKAKLSKLTHLDLTGAAMGRRDRFPLLAACLEVCTKLNHLDLSRNDLGAESLNTLLSALLKNRKHKLEVLNLGGNAIGGGGVGGAAIIASFVEFTTRAAASGKGKKRAKLRRLDLRANSLGDGSIRTIMMGMMSSTITHLYLAENAVGDAAVPHIVSGIEQMRQIETLDLSFNDIGPVGGAALAAGLSNKHPTLARLNVSWNRLGDKGACAFAKCLRKGTGALGELNLASNGVGDVGGSALVSTVLDAARGGLRVLRLDNNMFSSAVGRVLLRAAAEAAEAVGGRFRMGRLGSYGMTTEKNSKSAVVVAEPPGGRAGSRGVGNGSSVVVDGGSLRVGRASRASRSTQPGAGKAQRSSVAFTKDS